MHDTYYLVAIIDNNYIQSNLYSIFWEVLKIKQNNNNNNTESVLLSNEKVNSNVEF